MGRLSKEDVVAFFDRLAPYWDDEIIIDERKIETILDAAGVKVGSRVLDVACGTGCSFRFMLVAVSSTLQQSISHRK